MYQTINLPNGGTVEVWVNPPAPETHKTKKLTKTEYRSLFTANESIMIDMLRGKIEATTIAGYPTIDDNAAALGLGSLTYRDIMRSVFNAYADADAVDIDHPDTILAINAMRELGIYNQARQDVILLGLPL
jgi:hypothetical protein